MSSDPMMPREPTREVLLAIASAFVNGRDGEPWVKEIYRAIYDRLTHEQAALSVPVGGRERALEEALKPLIALANTYDEVARQKGDAPFPDNHRVSVSLGECRAARHAALSVPVGGPPTPSPTGTELALDEAKQHIAVLTRFWMDNPEWTKASEAARAFIGGIPLPVGGRERALEEAAKICDEYGLKASSFNVDHQRGMELAASAIAMKIRALSPSPKGKEV